MNDICKMSTFLHLDLIPRCIPILSCFWLSVACQPCPIRNPHPQEILRQYVRAAQEGDTKTMLDSLSSIARVHVTQEELKRFVKKNDSRFQASLQEEKSEKILPSEWQMTLSLANNEVVRFVYEEGQWRLNSGTLVPANGSDPESAIDLFLRAIETADCHMLLESAPPSVNQLKDRNNLLNGCKEEMNNLAEIAREIRKKATLVDRLDENTAELEFAPTHKLVLTRVDEIWYIQDLW